MARTPLAHPHQRRGLAGTPQPLARPGTHPTTPPTPIDSRVLAGPRHPKRPKLVTRRTSGRARGRSPVENSRGPGHLRANVDGCPIRRRSRSSSRSPPSESKWPNEPGSPGDGSGPATCMLRSAASARPRQMPTSSRVAALWSPQCGPDSTSAISPRHGSGDCRCRPRSRPTRCCTSARAAGSRPARCRGPPNRVGPRGAIPSRTARLGAERCLVRARGGRSRGPRNARHR